MNIYICEFSTGEYSDRSETAMVAFQNEDEAKSLVERSNQTLKDRGLHYDQEGRISSDRKVTLEGKEYHVDYTGAMVSYYPLELK